MNEDQPAEEEANLLTHWPRRAHTLNCTLTTQNPPKREDCQTTERETYSRLPDQKKEKTKEESSFATQAGMWTKEAAYHTRERARAFITRALPRKDRERERHDLRTWSTASIRGRQLSLSRSPTPTKTPRTLIFEDDHSKETGGSVRPHQPPSQRPLDLAWFNLDPEALSKRA